MNRLQIPRLVVGSLGLVFVVAVVTMVAGSLRRPEVPTYAPTPAAPHEVGDALIGPTRYTVDATSHDDWTYFDFSRMSVVSVETRRSLDWDIGFQRHRFITNSGDTNPMGQGGVLDLGRVSLDSAFELPVTGYTVDEQPGDVPRNRLLEDWYEYSWTSHLLTPADRAYAIRTADGRYAVVRILGYYCPGGRPGCVTFAYRYRGDGGTTLPPAPGSTAGPGDAAGAGSSDGRGGGGL